MAVRLFRANGPVHIEYYQKTASTDFALNEPVCFTTTGRLIAYTPGAVQPVLGLIKKLYKLPSFILGGISFIVLNFVFNSLTNYFWDEQGHSKTNWTFSRD